MILRAYCTLDISVRVHKLYLYLLHAGLWYFLFQRTIRSCGVQCSPKMISVGASVIINFEISRASYLVIGEGYCKCECQLEEVIRRQGMLECRCRRKQEWQFLQRVRSLTTSSER